MDNSMVFEVNDGVFWLSIIVGLLGIVALLVLYRFGSHVYSKTCWDSCRVKEHWVLDRLLNNQPTNNELKALVDTYADHRERRNEFWAIYGQVVLAIFIVLVLAILLLTKTISAEAGLPILSAVSGFAIAKGISSGKSSSGFGPNDDERRPRG
ncbi:hypothetical protein [Vibrio sp. 1CM7H]|uniref:hypothetical protein n=1 Tax=Vibrio sp. 1CM7H TaxID=2929168 RepID=UPI0020BF3B1C|nr:hypothetical protein [Vibrio sp. 1CM7H]MCK8064611.1 hypothetical protein [Vibrio sp. 1CM7H]